MIMTFKDIPVHKLVKAEWNYKVDDPSLLQKLKANISKNGLIENLIVRELGGDRFEVVNGNHRLQALIELGFDSAVCCNLGRIDDADAMRIALETNETRFATNEDALKEVLREVGTKYDPALLEETMPWSQEELGAMIDGIVDLSDLDLGDVAPMPTDDVELPPVEDKKHEMECPRCGHKWAGSPKH